MFPPELMELTPCLYSSKSLGAREKLANLLTRPPTQYVELMVFYFMKRVSRN